MLNTLYLQTFLAVVDAGNYTAAAEQLHMSQPAVSQHIRALEEQLGDVRLFRRSGQRMVPTHAGEELLVTARELVAMVERTEQNIRAMRGQTTGRVVIGCTANSGEYLLPPLLAAFRLNHPAVTLSVRVGNVEMLLNALTERQIDLLVLEEQQRRRGWESHMLGVEPICLIAPVDHPLLQSDHVPLSIVREYPCTLPGAGMPLRRTLEDALRRRGIALADLMVALECESINLLLQSVRSGMGLAFVPQLSLLPATNMGIVTLAGSPLQQEWYVLRERGKKMARAVQEVYAFMVGNTGQGLLQQHGLITAE